MEFNVINFNQKDKWKEIVKNKEIYYQWEYVEAFYKNNDGEPFLGYAQNEDNYVFNVFLKRNIADDERFKNKIEKEKYFDIITPYGYGGIDIINNKDENLLKFFFDEYVKYCKKNNIISEFVRLNPLSNNYELYKNTDYEITNISKTIYINLGSEEQIWNEMKSTCRNRIRKAKNSNLIVNSGFNKKMLAEFIDIYLETMNRDKAEKYYFFKKEFFDSIYENMRNNVMIYTAYFNDIPIDSVLIIYNGKNAHYHLGGTLSNYMKLGAHNLTLYEAAKDMYNLGYDKLHLGGGHGGDDSPLLRFKKTFNKESEPLLFYVGKKIFDKQKYEKLVKMRMEFENIDENSNFFPLYRKS